MGVTQVGTTFPLPCQAGRRWMAMVLLARQVTTWEVTRVRAVGAARDMVDRMRKTMVQVWAGGMDDA